MTRKLSQNSKSQQNLLYEKGMPASAFGQAPSPLYSNLFMLKSTLSLWFPWIERPTHKWEEHSEDELYKVRLRDTHCPRVLREAPRLRFWISFSALLSADWQVEGHLGCRDTTIISEMSLNYGCLSQSKFLFISSWW